jgi:hypothetical protein
LTSRRKKEEGRRKKEEGRGKREEGRGKREGAINLEKYARVAKPSLDTLGLVAPSLPVEVSTRCQGMSWF